MVSGVALITLQILSSCPGFKVAFGSSLRTYCIIWFLQRTFVRFCTGNRHRCEKGYSAWEERLYVVHGRLFREFSSAIQVKGCKRLPISPYSIILGGTVNFPILNTACPHSFHNYFHFLLFLISLCFHCLLLPIIIIKNSEK